MDMENFPQCPERRAAPRFGSNNTRTSAVIERAGLETPGRRAYASETLSVAVGRHGHLGVFIETRKADFNPRLFEVPVGTRAL